MGVSLASAPRSLASVVSLPDGDYRVEITVHRQGGSELVERRVELGDADRVTVSVR